MPGDRIKGFEAHGVDFLDDASADQAEGCCPFCGSEDRFYVNTTTHLWDCKRCNETGNFEQFLDKKASANQKRFTGVHAQRLANHRKLPMAALRGMGWGWDGSIYTLATRTAKGGVTDIRRFGLRWDRVLATSGGKISLGGIEQVKSCKGFVWLVEGEWDAAALRYALKIAGRTHDVVCWVPGATTFKPEWVPEFQGKHVIVAYDFDKAGEDGTALVVKRLKNVAKHLRFVVWPRDLKKGYDVRDYITRRMRSNKIHGVVPNLLKLVKDKPREPVWSEAAKKQLTDVQPDESVRTFDDAPISAEETVEGYRQFLELPNPDVLDVMFGTVFANRIDGDPLWTYLVGSAGAAKSELLMSLGECDEITCISTLTPQGFVSGAPDHGGTDPSLMAEIIGKVLVMKDMTAVFGLRAEAVSELFGYLRDAYDGKLDKKFGTGVIRAYKGTFGFLSGVTPALDAFTSSDAALGERFLKYRLPKQTRKVTDNILRRTIQSVLSEPAKRHSLKEVAVKALNRDLPKTLPGIDTEAEDAIMKMAYYAAQMRAHVLRDRYEKDVVLARPDVELPTRLAKQLAKLAIGIAIFRNHDRVGEHELRICAQVARDTPPDRSHDVVLALKKAIPKGGKLTLIQLQERTGYPRTTLQRKLDDMVMLGIVKKYTGSRNTYQLTPLMKDILV